MDWHDVKHSSTNSLIITIARRPCRDRLNVLNLKFPLLQAILDAQAEERGENGFPNIGVSTVNLHRDVFLPQSCGHSRHSRDASTKCGAIDAGLQWCLTKVQSVRRRFDLRGIMLDKTGKAPL